MVNFRVVAKFASRARCFPRCSPAIRGASVAAATSPSFLRAGEQRRIFQDAIRRFHSSSAVLGDDGATADYSELMVEKEFHRISNATLEHLQEKIEDFGDKNSIEEFDTDYAEGVLTVRLGDLGTFVINKQTPNRQIWLSSPLSGPARFDWIDSKWVYRRTKTDLHSLLQKEFQALVKRPLDLSD